MKNVSEPRRHKPKAHIRHDLLVLANALFVRSDKEVKLNLR